MGEIGMYDYSKLRGLIREKRFIQDEIAKAIPINAATLSQKLSGKGLFKQNEISAICKILDIPSADIGVYFFTN